jgi:hypothetical protein
LLLGVIHSVNNLKVMKRAIQAYSVPRWPFCGCAGLFDAPPVAGQSCPDLAGDSGQQVVYISGAGLAGIGLRAAIP